jgi:peptidoglycan hydrolase-like protein with peptidoglycan-binding domain
MKAGSEAMKGGRAAGGADAEQVKAIQQALKDKGHDPGEIDGVMGPKTRAALRDYQKKEGLKATGQLDKETAAKLGVQAKADTSSPAASPSGTPSGKPSSSGGASSGATSSTPSGSSDASTPSTSTPSGGASGSTGAKTK